MSKVIKLRKGLDIKLKGTAKLVLRQAEPSQTYAVKPTDFTGLTPKLLVKPDTEVKAGTPLFFDKYQPDIKFASPVSGKVVAVNRGERRRILEVVVKPDGKNEYESFTKGSPSGMSRDEIVKNMLQAGVWPMVVQRPYGVIANPEDKPKAIFVSAFDSSPLAPDYAFALKEDSLAFQTGLDALAKLTEGTVHLNLHSDKDAGFFSSAKNVNINTFSGPHPSGTVGVQIHHIDPINKGDIVWTVNAQDVAIIGRLFETGTYKAEKVIAVCGSEMKDPAYVKVISGASIYNLVNNKVEDGDLRFVGGSVLSGEKIQKDGFLGFYANQLVALPEGNKPELFGWATPGFNKMSASRSFFSWLNPNKEYTLNTNMRGGHRPFIVTGEYEKFVPMDILPVQLIKAIIVEDIDLIEQLGIYEVVEEDFALCEFACTSKTPVQTILRQGLDMVRKEFS